MRDVEVIESFVDDVEPARRANAEGAGASLTSRTSNANRGCAPSPFTSNSRYVDFVLAPPSRYTGTTAAYSIASRGKKVHFTVVDWPGARTPTLGSNVNTVLMSSSRPCEGVSLDTSAGLPKLQWKLSVRRVHCATR